jgi:hypothetical protein
VVSGRRSNSACLDVHLKSSLRVGAEGDMDRFCSAGAAEGAGYAAFHEWRRAHLGRVSAGRYLPGSQPSNAPVVAESPPVSRAYVTRDHSREMRSRS